MDGSINATAPDSQSVAPVTIYTTDAAIIICPIEKTKVNAKELPFNKRLKNNSIIHFPPSEFYGQPIYTRLFPRLIVHCELF